MAGVQVAVRAVLNLAEVDDDVLPVCRHAGAIEAALVHLFKICYFKLPQASASSSNGKSFLSSAFSSFDKNVAFRQYGKYLIGAVYVKRRAQVFRCSPNALGIFFRHPDVLRVIFTQGVIRMVLYEKIQGVAVWRYDRCSFVVE